MLSRIYASGSTSFSFLQRGVSNTSSPAFPKPKKKKIKGKFPPLPSHGSSSPVPVTTKVSTLPPPTPSKPGVPSEGVVMETADDDSKSLTTVSRKRDRISSSGPYTRIDSSESDSDNDDLPQPQTRADVLSPSSYTTQIIGVFCTQF